MRSTQLQMLKLVHTLIWFVMASSNFLAFYLAFIGRFDMWFWMPASLLLIETGIILLNGWKCPLTNIAEKMTSERSPNFDIYLPEGLAKYNKEIFTGLIVVEILIIIFT